MTKDTYTFKREYDFEYTGARGTTTITRESADWTELADEFVCFLSGCGFIVTRQDVSDYLNSETIELDDD